MERPPLILFYPSYVVEFMVVDSSVQFIDKMNLYVNGEWLGAVPNLAICYEFKNKEFHLAHCDENWGCLTAIQTAKTSVEIKAMAEKYYAGSSTRWIKTGYLQADAEEVYEQEVVDSKCSFCDQSPYESDIGTVFSSSHANICKGCITDLYGKI